MAFNPKEHLTNLNGREYLEVKWRLVWFRETHPNGSITTDLVSIEPPIVKATIADEVGHILATGLASAILPPSGNAVWKTRLIEKAETAAIGRALAVAGFGTQFSDDDESDYLADSPVEKKRAQPERRAQPANDAPESGNGHAKIERPMAPATLIDSLKRKAASYTKPTDKLVITKSQLIRYHERVKEWIGDIPRRYLQHEAFEVEHSSELTSGQLQAMLSWLPSRETLAAMPETVTWIEQEIGAIEIEALEAAQPETAEAK